MVEFLRVCVFMVSLLTLKDPTIFEEDDDDDIFVDIQAQDNLLQKQEALLEQEVPSVHSVGEELPQVSQHQQSKKEEREELDLQLSAKEGKPQEQQMQPMEGQSGLHYEPSTEDSHQTSKTLDKQAPNVDNAHSLIDKDLSSGKEIKSAIEHGGHNETNKVLSTANEIVSKEDAVSVHTKEAQIDYKEALDDILVSSSTSAQHPQKDLDQMKMTDEQTSPEDSKEIPQKHQMSFFQRAVNGLLQGWFQDSQDKHTESDNESFEGGTQQQLQVTQKTEEVSQTDERLSEVHQRHSRTSNEPSNADLSSSSQVQGATKRPENVYMWYFWNVLSLASLIRLLLKFISKILKISGLMREDSLVLEGKTLSEPVLLNISARMSLLDNKVLSCFYEQCVQTPNLGTRERICDFVEGFVDELLGAARNTDIKGTDLQIGDPVGVGSLYELWATGKTMVCDLYVPITAPRSYSFDFEIDMPSHGKIKMVKAESTSNGCPCANGMSDEDMLCLLHSHNETSKIVDAVGGPLCQENTPYLSRKQVVRWFRKRISEAWKENSHKYEFELAFRNQAAPGALKVRLRSGQVMLFNLTPVVQIKGSEVYLLTYLPSNHATTNFADTHWPVSLASYEKALLKHFNQSLLNDYCHIPCLQILSFLHKQQNILTGKCGLKSYHLKMALLHLLLTNKPEDWMSEQLACRLTDMLTFLAQRLQEGKFHHTLVNNPLVPSDIGLPKEVQSAKPINIFLPLLSDRRLYLRTVEHLQELVKNAPVVIQEYVSRDCSRSSMN